jgi:hypothetical protein
VTPTCAALARRLSLHPAWRWQRGALCLRWAPGFADHLKPEATIGDTFSDADARGFGSVPDLDDPATVGTVEEQVREVNPDVALLPTCNGNPLGTWVVVNNFGWDTESCLSGGATRGEAWGSAFLEVHQ